MSVIPASRAAWIVAMLSARSAGPYRSDMPMHPSPSSDTSGPVRPSLRVRTATAVRSGACLGALLLGDDVLLAHEAACRLGLLLEAPARLDRERRARGAGRQRGKSPARA